MAEFEILDELILTPDQQKILDLHSVLNVLSVLSNELNILNLLAAKPPELKPSLEHMKKLKAWLLQEPGALFDTTMMADIRADILKSVSSVVAHYPELSGEVDLELYEQNIRSLFEIIGVRAEELRCRLNDPLIWAYLAVAEVRDKLVHVFEAIELNSHGKYHIVYSPQDKQVSDYLLDIEVVSAAEPQIYLPLVLLDIMRDLTANARKYTLPGGVIKSSLQHDGHQIRLSIRDTGIGIPEAELSQIVNFGQRGSNIQGRRTMGGGFGLTKALFFTQKLGGRMWIHSVEGEGTCVLLKIPISACTVKQD